MAILKPRLFCSHATSHKVDWILTNMNSLTNIFEAEDSHSRFLDNSIATAWICALSYVFPHSCYYWFTWIVFDGFLRCAFCTSLIAFIHTHSLCFCSFCLLFSCKMILSRFYLRNSIKHAFLKRYWKLWYVRTTISFSF